MYLWLKLIHVLAVVAFLGNITTGLIWHAHAARSGDSRLLVHTMDGIIRSDRLITVPGVIVIILSGVGAAIVGGYPILGTPWILWSLILFGVSGLVFSLRIAPLQRQLLHLARTSSHSGQFDRESYQRLARAWELWGAVGLLTPAAALVLMVLKPGF